MKYAFYTRYMKFLWWLIDGIEAHYNRIANRRLRTTRMRPWKTSGTDKR